jgi:acyl-CoA synthetase (AMP-forming)/AMP-acid ligase II
MAGRLLDRVLKVFATRRLRYTASPRTPARLRAAATRSLPPYTLPSRWIAPDALPRAPRGKFDRRKERFAPETVGVPR